MRILNRLLAQTPPSLANFDYQVHKWSDFWCKGEVWSEIYKFQSSICCYCESPAFKGSGHIEHFFHKSSPLYKHLTFEWSNLFGCCESNKHCGHYKDGSDKGSGKRIYDAEKLLKPDVDNPEDFFQFNNFGFISVKNNITQEKIERASETIKALNLYHPELNSYRENKIKYYQEQLECLNNLSHDLTELEFEEEYERLRVEAMSGCYSSALKQVIFS